ncbi:unnamed protein product [Darwinula stevensoni]|uniref:Uncharacterized protein n=1 Tax=Darwinula stevensoni TaxID=69355 RepID=A0A7R8X7X6_9CRUS|nr:unnamed protein product [Darwinula stevensoni]CAG0889553.1 unnamed protein product [Darwinula stevensoni]
MLEPTWNDTAKIIAEETVNKEEIFDRNTGKINCLSQETWDALNEVLPLPKYSSPFRDWGYAWGEWAGEVPRASAQNSIQETNEITKFLEEKGVKWKPKKWPPVPLNTQSSGVGLLESLSLVLTGSLLHLSLLQNILGGENHRPLFELIQEGAEIFKRVIVLMGKKLSRTFFPKGERDENQDLHAILLFALFESHEDSASDLESKTVSDLGNDGPVNIFPVVPQCTWSISEGRVARFEAFEPSRHRGISR